LIFALAALSRISLAFLYPRQKRLIVRLCLCTSHQKRVPLTVAIFYVLLWAKSTLQAEVCLATPARNADTSSAVHVHAPWAFVRVSLSRLHQSFWRDTFPEQEELACHSQTKKNQPASQSA